MTTSTISGSGSFEVYNPLDGSLLDLVAEATADDVRRVVTGLRDEQVAWSALPVSQRVQWMHRFRDWLLDNTDRVNGLLQQETGKPVAELTIEIASSLAALRYYTSHAEEFLRDDTPRPSSPLTAMKQLRVRHVAYPVVGVISPWNFPIAMFLWDSIPALLAGAAVVVKPSEQTPLATAAVVDGWSQIGAPPVFTVLHGAGPTGEAVVDAVDYVHFTGSTRTGIAIATRAAAQLKPYSLELGGKDPAIVMADADVEQAAASIAFNGMVNSGQMCVATERVYVHDSVHDKFVDAVVERVRELRQDGSGPDSDVTGLITPQQLEIVTDHVADALAHGAHLRCGGQVTGVGLGYEPTVLTDVDHTMRVMTDETFGPVLPIMRFSSDEDAVRLANDSAFGLSASVWSRDRNVARSVAERLEVGTVNINDGVTHLLCHPIPQSGWKSSGVGARLGGRQGILKYTRSQAMTENRVQLSVVGAVAGFPYSASKTKMLRTVGNLVDGGSWRGRLGLTALQSTREVQVEREIPASAADVFAWLENGHNFLRGLPAFMVEHRTGTHSRFGVGSVRDLLTPLGVVREQVTAHRQHELLGYVITSPLPPLRHLGAEIGLHPSGPNSTRVVWTSRFAGPAVAQNVAAAVFTQIFGRILASCADAFSEPS
ncbi:MAG: aldehyde dehydrogenase family protein [Propionibacteriales bacterium]|nr:aldehyde dehydrogenase family protein [Propionibacteriales bacterium]